MQLIAPFKLSSISVIAATATIVLMGTPRTALASSRLICEAGTTSFQIVLENQGSSTTLLTVNNSAIAEQTCSQIAARLQSAIDAGGLDQLMLVADPDRGVCIVRSTDYGCRRESRILNIPIGMTGDQFLSSILDVEAEGFFVGDAGQHTARRYYVRLGQAVTELDNK